MTTIDFNTKPYFDDFDDSKNYQKILFKPSFAVQARELTQLQTISQNQIKKLADVSLSNGDRLNPGELIYSNKISYVQMTFNSAANITKTLSSLVTAGTSGYVTNNGVTTSGGTGTGLTVDIVASAGSVSSVSINASGSGYSVGDTITITGGSGDATFTITAVHAGITNSNLVGSYIGSSDGVVGKIIHYEPSVTGGSDAFTLYVSYLKSNVSQSGVSDSDFKFSNNTELFQLNTDGSLGTNSIGKTGTSATGLGSAILLKTGSYYVNGYIVTVPSQVMVLDKFGTTPSYRVGFNVSQSFTTSNDDSSLLDNASGSSNKGAGGADRHKIQLVLGKKSLTPDSTANEDFVEILKVVGGTLIEKDQSLDQNLSGENKILEPYEIEIRENLSTLTDSYGLEGIDSGGNAGKLSVGVSSGSIQYNGKSVNTESKQYVTIDKSRESKTYSNYSIGAELGGYVLTRDGLANTLDGEYRKWLARLFTNGTYEGYVKVNLVEFDGNDGVTNIGSARVRNIKQHSRSNDSNFDGECRIYLTDITFSAGKNMSNVMALYTAYGTTDKLVCYLETDKIHGSQFTFSNVKKYGKDNTHTILHDIKYDKSFYPLGVDNVKSIGTVKPQRLRWSTDVSVGGSVVGNLTVNAPTGYYFVDGTEHEVFAYGTWDGSTDSGPMLNGSADSSGTTITNSNNNVIEYYATISGSTDTTLILTASRDNSNNQLYFKANTTVTVVADIVPNTAWTSGNSLALTQLTLAKDAGTSSTSRVISLNQPRVLEKNFKVYMSRDFDTAVGASPYTNDMDITDWYTIDSGMRDNLVMHGSLIRKSGYPEPRGRITIKYFYLNETNSNRYLGVGSYPVGTGTHVDWVSLEDGGTTFRYADIPTYTSESGEKYRLSDVLDFRPTISGNGETSSVLETKPLVNEATTIDITNLAVYQARIDKIYIKGDGTPAVKVGSSFTDYPNIPTNPDDGLSIFNIKVLPYTHNTKDVVIQKIDDPSKSHIGELAKFSLEGILQNSTENEVLDFATCKTNVLSDAFYGSDSGNINDPDNSVSYDLVNHSIRPKFTESEIEFEYCSGTSTDLLTSSNIVTLPTTSTSTIEIQNIASSTSDTIRSTDVDTYYGHMDLTPSFDSWKSTESNPEIIFNENGVYDSVGTSNQNTIWNGWKDNWYGTEQSSCFQNPSFGSGFTPQLDFCSGVNYSSDPSSFVPFIQSQEIGIKVDGLKPSTVGHKLYLDDVDISDAVIYNNFGSNTDYFDCASSTLRSDSSGTFCGTYFIPNIDEGSFAIKLSSSTNNFVDGDLIYQGPSVDRATATGEVVCWVGDSSIGYSKVIHLKNVSGEFSSGCVCSEGATLCMASMSSGTDFTVGERVAVVANAGCGYGDGFSFGIVTGWTAGTCMELKVTSLTGEDFSTCQSCYIKGETSNTVAQLETTSNGFYYVASGEYSSIVGGKKFKTGKRIFKIESTDSYSESIFDATGNVEQGRTIPYGHSWDNQTQNSLSQVVDVKEPFYATSVDLFFNSKDANHARPVTVQLRKVENGIPSNKIIPYTTVTKTPSNVTCTSNGTTATNFAFSEKVYLGKGQYSITISTSAMEYSLMTLDINSGKGARTIDVGNMFRGTKKVTDKIVKFSLKRATFNISPSTGDVILRNKDLSDVRLNTNSYSVNDSNDLARRNIQYVCLENYGFSTNDCFLLDGLRGKQGHKININTTWNAGAKVYSGSDTATAAGASIVSVSGSTYVIYPGTAASGSYTASGITWGTGAGQTQNIYCEGSAAATASAGAIILNRFVNGIEVCDLNTHSLACCKQIMKAQGTGNSVIAPLSVDPSPKAGLWETLSPFEDRIIIRNSNIRSDGEYYHIPEIIPEYTSLVWTLSDDATMNDSLTTTCSFTPNDNFYRGTSFNIQGSSLASGSKRLYLRACMTSTCNKVSPAFNFNSMRAIAISNIVDNSTYASFGGALGCVNFNYSENRYCETTYFTPSFYISKTLQTERPANAVKVLVDAIIPYCSDLKIYGKTSGHSSGVRTGGTSGVMSYCNYGHQSNTYSEICSVNCISSNDGLDFKTVEFKQTGLSPYNNINLKIDLTAGDTSRVPIIRGLKLIPYSEECSLKPLETLSFRGTMTVPASGSCTCNIVTNFEVEHGETFIIRENTTSTGCSCHVTSNLICNTSTGRICSYKYDGTGATLCLANTHSAQVGVEYMLFLYGRRK